jgi:hypothetical protein
MTGDSDKSGTELRLLPLAMIGIGAVNLWRGMHSTTWIVLNWLLIAAGGMLFLLRASLKASGVGLTPSSAAKNLVAQQRQLYAATQVYRDATEADLARLDRTFYEQATRDLAAEGYHLTRDIVNVTASNTWPRNHAVIRCLLGDDGTTMAGVYHLKLLGPMRIFQWIRVLPRRLKAIECETELSDGTFVTTTDTEAINKSLKYPFIDAWQFPSKTPVARLVAEHRNHVAAILALRNGVTAMRCTSYADLRASQDRLHLLKAAYRASPEFDHAAEWQKILGRPLSPAQREAVALYQQEKAQLARAEGEDEPENR